MHQLVGQTQLCVLQFIIQLYAQSNMEALKPHCELSQLNLNTTYQNVHDFLYFYCMQAINMMSDSSVLEGHLNKISVS